MTCARRTDLGQKWLQPRKRRGTTACPEKAQIVETVYDAAGQGKTCMAKAILLEPQFAATNPWSGVAERLTRQLGWSGGALTFYTARRPLVRTLRPAVNQPVRRILYVRRGK